MFYTGCFTPDENAEDINPAMYLFPNWVFNGIRGPLLIRLKRRFRVKTEQIGIHRLCYMHDGDDT